MEKKRLVGRQKCRELLDLLLARAHGVHSFGLEALWNECFESGRPWNPFRFYTTTMELLEFGACSEVNALKMVPTM
jgi:hypothetical protein